MNNLSENDESFLTDPKGNRLGVVLNMEYYKQLLAAKEELESIQAYDEAKASGDDEIPFEQALQELKNRTK